MNRTVLAAAVALGLVACATLDSSLRSYIGHPVDDAIRTNGAPAQTAKLPRGGTAYTWIQRRGYAECWITFTTDQEEIIRAASYRGCP